MREAMAPATFAGAIVHPFTVTDVAPATALLPAPPPDRAHRARPRSPTPAQRDIIAERYRIEQEVKRSNLAQRP